MSSEDLVAITSLGTNGETAPEACVLAERMQDAGIDAHSPPTGDRVLYVSDDDLDADVREMLSESHYTTGLPSTATEADGYTAFKPKRGRHPDRTS